MGIYPTREDMWARQRAERRYKFFRRMDIFDIGTRLGSDPQTRKMDWMKIWPEGPDEFSKSRDNFWKSIQGNAAFKEGRKAKAVTRARKVTETMVTTEKEFDLCMIEPDVNKELLLKLKDAEQYQLLSFYLTASSVM